MSSTDQFAELREEARRQAAELLAQPEPGAREGAIKRAENRRKRAEVRGRRDLSFQGVQSRLIVNALLYKQTEPYVTIRLTAFCSGLHAEFAREDNAFAVSGQDAADYYSIGLSTAKAWLRDAQAAGVIRVIRKGRVRFAEDQRRPNVYELRTEWS